MLQVRHTDMFQSAYDQVSQPEQAFVDRFNGRVPIERFCRELLKDTRHVCGFYDATVKAVDPFPDRDTHQAPTLT